MKDQLFGCSSGKYRVRDQIANVCVLLGLLICLKLGTRINNLLNQGLKWHAIAQYKLYFETHSRAPW